MEAGDEFKKLARPVDVLGEEATYTCADCERSDGDTAENIPFILTQTSSGGRSQ